MKYLGAVSLFLVLVVIAVMPRPVAAETIVIEQHIIIKARVAAYHTVIVNDDDVILEIISNSDGAANVRVFRNVISKNNQIQLTENLYEKYLEIIPEGKGYTGRMYKYFEFKAFSFSQINSGPKDPVLALL